MNRREFVTIAGTGLIATLAGCGGGGGTPDAAPVTSVPSTSTTGDVFPLAKYVDKLPVPSVLAPAGRSGGATAYEVTMTQFSQKLHRDLPPTTLWGYNGTYPGPTIESLSSESIRVRWVNRLPMQHLFTVDPTIHCGDTAMGCNPAVRNTVHVHGGLQPAASDGFPEDWSTPGGEQTFDYPAAGQRPTTLWYHDHALGITRLNVYAGLAGFRLIRDPEENLLPLPKGGYEIPILIQDRSFNPDGSLSYPVVGDVPDLHPNWVPEYFADTAVVNGKVWPYLEVEPRRYRFRMLNGCNARFLVLRIAGGPAFTQIGSDGGFLQSPVVVDELILAPAERADVIVDFAAFGGQRLVLTNSAPAPFPGGGEEALPEIMQFRVGTSTGVDTTRIPAVLSINAARVPESEATRVVDFTLNEVLDDQGNSLGVLLDNKHWDDPLADADRHRLGTTEIWRIINTTGDTHPIHVHLIDFQILDRQPFDEEIFETQGRVVATGPAAPPDPNEMGWKDTVRCPPGQVTRLIMRWEGFAGKYVWHCHILEHEDNEMMRPMEVTAG